MRDELFKRERRSFLSVWKITILFTPSHGISKTWDIILPLKSFSYKTPTYRGIISRKYFLKYINLTNCRFFRDHGLADTGEDSKLGPQVKTSRSGTLFSSLFFRRVRATSMTYSSFRLYRLSEKRILLEILL